MKTVNLAGANVLITAGPTREHIDPIRYITNHKGGRLGYDLASGFLERGARVFLVSGPVKVDLVHPMLTVVKVNTAFEMYMACCKFFEEADIVIFGAAVSDFRPQERYDQKIKTDGNAFTLKLVKNIDIAAAFAKVKRPDQATIGVTFETGDDLHEVFGKIETKNFDLLIVKTLVNDDLGEEISQLSIVKNDYSVHDLPMESKKTMVDALMNEIVSLSDEKKASAGGAISHKQEYHSI